MKADNDSSISSNQFTFNMYLFPIFEQNQNGMISRIWAYIFVPLVLLSCGVGSDKMSNWNEMSLLEHGIPFSILAPDSSKVETIDYGSIMKDVTVKNGEDYFVQIFASDANTTNMSEVKAEQLKEVRAQKHFSKIVEESDKGFLYESKKDSTTTYYGFRYIRLQGTKEYILQNGFRGFFTEDQARSMYKAVSSEPAK